LYSLFISRVYQHKVFCIRFVSVFFCFVLFLFFLFFSWNKKVLYLIGVKKEVVETMIYHSPAGSTGAICDSETVIKLLYPVTYCSTD